MRYHFRRSIAVALAIVLPGVQIFPAFAVATDGTAANWTREKAEHLARKTLFAATPTTVDSLYSAGSAASAVNLLFPDSVGPDRSAFNAEIGNLTGSGFNWGDGGSMYKYYQYRLARDPFEAKAKFSLLFEDIFSVNANGGTISYLDVKQQQDLLYSQTLGNYKTMVKRVLSGNGNPGDYAEGKFLDLLDQSDKRYPNENYARELLQLFLMGEYEPGKSKDSGDVRNYEETDVAAFAKILTGFRSDSVTHVVSYDPTFHNTSTGVLFLSGASSVNFPFYDSASGTLDLGAMETPLFANNGLADNAIDYVFAKRQHQIALFLANRIFRFYAHDNPRRQDVDALASVLESNAFDLLPAVKTFLSSDAMYSDASMNALSYKTPVELTIGTAKLLHYKDPSAVDPMLSDTSLLSRFNWTPYSPGSVFGRDGYDDNAKWYSTYLQNQWISYANRVAFVTGTGAYSVADYLPVASNPVNIATSVITSSGNAYTGSVILLSGTADVTPAVVGSGASETLAFGALSVNLPEFSLDTPNGKISITSGLYDPIGLSLTVTSGTLQPTASGALAVAVSSGSFAVSAASSLSRLATPADLIDKLQTEILLGRQLPSDVRTKIETFLTTDELGNAIAFAPSDANYQRKKIRAAVAMVLSQPEYVLQTGYDLPASTAGVGSSPVTNAIGKLIVVELGGGYDWLHGVIPKSEYADYVAKRTLASGSGIALDTGRLTDLGDLYLNNAIAYGSGGSASFKSLWDSNNLRIFNRVGTTNHSRDHDAAAKQIASYGNTTTADADGIIGRLVKDDPNSVDAISLGNRRPNVFRSGRYANIGPSGAILSNGYVSQAEATSELNAIRDIAGGRAYPGIAGDVFQGAMRIDQVATQSKAAGGPDGAGWGNVNNLKFLETLLDNGVGKTFYMQADGGYDTHSNQLAPSSNFDPNNVPKDLNYNIGNVASRLTDFFNRVKARHDVTIVVFSEFGRTVAVNGDVGTDHGEGGGMFVLSNNSNLLAALPQKAYGNLSFKDSKDNWLGVGIDYRSVYGKIYNALYGLSDTTYFGETADLARDVDLAPARFALMRPEYKANNDGYARVDIRFVGEGNNFDTSKSSYLQAWYGTGMANLNAVNRWTIDNYYQKTPDKSFTFARDWNAEKSNYAYATKLFTSQYAATSYSGTIRLPEVLAAGVNAVSLTGDSVLRTYDSTAVNSRNSLPGNGLLITDSGTGAGVSVTSLGGVTLSTQTGATHVRALTASGTLTWNGGFILGETVNPATFLSDKAMAMSGSTALRSMNVAKIVKVGADTLGVGMELDQSVVLSFTGVAPSSEFRILRSEDGISWIDQSGSTIFSNASGRLAFATDKFSFFAAVSVVPPSAPTCSVTAAPTSVTNGNSVVLNWNSTDSSSAVLTPGNSSIALTGSLSLVPPPNAVTTYRVDVSGAGGTAFCSIFVTSSAAASGGGSGGSSNNSGTFS